MGGGGKNLLAACPSAFSSSVEIDGSEHLGSSTGGERGAERLPYVALYDLGADLCKRLDRSMMVGWKTEDGGR